MFKILRPLKTLILVVVFLVLAVVASVNFSVNDENKEAMQNGFFWQTGNKIISTALSGLNLLSSKTLEKKDEVEELVKDGTENRLSKIWSEFKEKISSISLDKILKK